MIGFAMTYVPLGKYTMAGVVVEDSHTHGAQRLPSVIAALMAAESSVTPSPVCMLARGDSTSVATYLLRRSP